MLRFSARFLTGTAIAAIAPVAATAQAQPAVAPDTAAAATHTDPQTADIVVTAQRRAESVTNVPISITVASQAQLQRQQVNTVNDLNRIAPALEINASPGQNTGGGGSIRGIGTQTFSAGAVASVGVVVDQVSQGNANISDLFDIARVEVLKGPQGTLFGLTTSAGVINITTNAPDTHRFSGAVHSELSNAGTAGSKFGDQIVQGVINVPISEDAAIRVAGLLNRRQGVDRNTYTGDLNDDNRYGGRARLLWKPTSTLTFNLIGDYTRERLTNGGDFFTFTRAAGAGILPLPTPFPIPDSGVVNQLASCGVTPRIGNRDYCTQANYATISKNYGGSGEVDFDAGPFTLTSITSYRRSSETGAGIAADIFRADPLEIHVANGTIADRQLKLFTEEFRLTSPSNQFLEYTVGAFYSHQREHRDPENLNVTLTPFPGVTIPVQSSIGANDTIVDESMAVFGQATMHITPAFRLIAGGRFTQESITLDRINYDLGPADREHLDLNVSKISYRFGAQYNLTRATMLYATVSKGYKGGQIATPTLPLLPYLVQPERPMDYEAGFKTTILGGWVVDLNGFYTKIANFQSQQCTTNPATAAISCVQTNISGVKTRGAEINLFGRVFEGLSVNTGFIYAKATYPKTFIGTDGTNIGGSQLTYAPRYKFTFSGEYEHPVTEAFKGFVAADAVWKSRVKYEATSLPESTYLAHWLLGGRFGVRTADERFSVAIFARNLLNVHEPLLIQTSLPYGGAANVGAIYGTQSFRQLGLSLDGKF